MKNKIMLDAKFVKLVADPEILYRELDVLHFLSGPTIIFSVPWNGTGRRTH